MTSLSKKPAVVAKTARKRGRPVGSKNKPKIVKLLERQVQDGRKKAKSFKFSLETQVANLTKRVAELEMIRDRLHNIIDRMENKEIQYRAVIDYLETKLELE